MSDSHTLPYSPGTVSRKEGEFTYLLQDELLILWSSFFAEMHDKDIHSCFHSNAALWLVGVIAYFFLGRVLEKLKMG